MTAITTGLELELWVVDDAGRLCDGRHLADAHERITPEFVGPLLEVRTAPHDTDAGLRRDLQSVLEAALAAARADGKRLVPLGTPLSPVEASADDERGRLFEEIYGDGVESAKNCAGTHIHLEQAPTDAGVCDQLTLLTALDPALALVSSSPYYRGGRGVDSSRALAYRRACGRAFRPFCDIWPYPDSLAAWQARVDDAYELFLRFAADRGVSPERVKAAFSPEDTVLTPVRLRRHQPTVEWRAPDSALPGQLLRLASDVRDLVGHLETSSLEVGTTGVTDGRIGVPRFETVRDLGDRAIVDGLSDDLVRAYLRRMGFDPDAYRPITGQLDGPRDLSPATARRYRLEYATRLEADVRSLAGHRGPARPATGQTPYT